MKKGLIVSLLFNVFIVLFLIGKRLYWSYGPPSRILINTAYIEGRRSVIDQFGIDSNDIVFVGNSLTEGFPLNEYFPKKAIHNRGVGSSLTIHILDRIECIAQFHPRKIFLEIGINDICNNRDLDSSFENYKKIVAKIKAISPRTEIFIQSLFPVSGSYKPYNSKILSFNNRLEKEIDNVIFINLYPRFLKDNFLNSEYTYDGLHLNGKGYEVWAKVIEAYLL